MTSTDSPAKDHDEPRLDLATSRILVRFLEDLYAAIAAESRRDIPRPGRVLSTAGGPPPADGPARLEAYLAELLDRLIASQILLYGRAVRAWSDRTHRSLDPDRRLHAVGGLFEMARKARAFDALRPLIDELRPAIVEQEIDAEFRRLHDQTRRA